jgi:hypothetical protein
MFCFFIFVGVKEKNKNKEICYGCKTLFPAGEEEEEEERTVVEIPSSL